MNHRPTRIAALRAYLTRIHETSERLEGGGAVLSGPAGYLSGVSYLFSTDVNQAFRFKYAAQAGEVKRQFPDLLAKYRTMPRGKVGQ